MENAKGHNPNTHADMKREPTHNTVPLPGPAAAVNRCDLDEELEMQYLDQADKISLNNAKKKSFFQITSVTENVNDENDSMDELDESRTDDISAADLSNMSKLSLQTDAEHSEADDPSNPAGTVLNANAALNPNSEANGNGPSRFKLVKVARIEPIRRGRWTCKDFPNEPQPGPDSAVAKTEQLKDNVSGSSSAASSVHYVPGENPLTENPLGEMNSLPQQPPPPSSDQKTKEATSTNNNEGASSTIASHRPSTKTVSSKDSVSKKESSDLPSLDSLNVDMHADNLSENDESTSATGGAIDNKIEQAMDLVKSHLLFAVREEVEILKEQIKELLEKNEQLQRENKALRQSQSQGLPQHLPYNQPETAQAKRQPVGAPAGAQDQGAFQSIPGAAAPRPDAYPPQQPGGGEQPFPGIQAAGGPALPQQQASQYGHIQPPPQQQQHSLPQQTSTQHSQPPSQT